MKSDTTSGLECPSLPTLTVATMKTIMRHSTGSSRQPSSLDASLCRQNVVLSRPYYTMGLPSVTFTVTYGSCIGLSAVAVPALSCHIPPPRRPSCRRYTRKSRAHRVARVTTHEVCGPNYFARGAHLQNAAGVVPRTRKLASVCSCLRV